MSMGLYFTDVVFLLFSTPNLWDHWTDLNQTWTHIHLWLLFEKFGPNSTGHLPPPAGRQNRFFGTDFEIWPNISLRRNTISTIGKKLFYQQGLPYTQPKLGEIWSRNGSERLASFCPPPYIFSLRDTASLTAWTLYNRQQAHIGTCYVVERAYSLYAGRAHAGLCHASGYYYYYDYYWPL